MSNQQLIESIYDAYSRGDLADALARFGEDAVVSQSPGVPWGGVYRGVEGVTRFFSSLGSHIETRVEVERMISAGDCVVETGRTCGRALHTGNEFEIDETHVWRIRDGKVVAMEAFVDEPAMRAALELD